MIKKLQGDLFLQKFNKQILKDKSISAIDCHQNPIIALLNGPDNQYEKILMNENEQINIPIVNDRCRDKNAFLQIHVRPLNAKQQNRLLKKQFKRHHQSIKKKDKCLHFTFPITYPCPMKSKRNHSSIISNSSISSPNQSLKTKSNSQLSNNLNQLKSAVKILFNDDKNDNISTYKIPKENYSSSLLLNIPSKKLSTHKIHSSNACIEKHLCQLCGSILSNGICSCIIQNLLKLNNTKKNHILVQFNDIFENLTSNNIIT